MSGDVYNGCPYTESPYGVDGCDEDNPWAMWAQFGLSSSIEETLTGPVHVNTTLATSLAVTSPVSNVHLWPLSTALSSGSTIDYDLVWGTVTALSAETSATLVKTMTWLASESAAVTSDPRWVAKLVTTESVAISGAISGPIQRLLPIITYVAANSSITASHSFITAVAASIVADSLATLVKALDAEDTVDIDDAVVFLVRLVTTALSSLLITDTVTQGLVILLPIETELDLVSALASQHAFTNEVSDTVSFVGALQLEDGDFSVWSVNSDLIAATEYESYPFNSFAFSNRRYLAASADGIYELVGSNDDGTEIEAYVRTGLLDLGTTALKQVIRAYLGYTSDGRLLLKTFTTDGGQKIERWYELTDRTADATREARVKFGKGVKARYWQFEVRNIDGSDFSIDQLQVLPLMLSRRVKE